MRLVNVAGTFDSVTPHMRVNAGVRLDPRGRRDRVAVSALRGP